MAKNQIEVKTPHDIFLDELYIYLKHSGPRMEGLTREMIKMRPHDKSAITTVSVDNFANETKMAIEINLIIDPQA